MPTLNGIDISGYTKTVDLDAVAANYRYIIIKATEGAGAAEDNPMFAGPTRTDWADAKTAGVIRGAYHLFYARPTSSTPKAQADHFLSVMSDFKPGDLAPAIDLEPGLSFQGITDKAAAVDAVLTWLSLVEAGLKAITGKSIKPFIYANPSVINDELGNPDAFADYPLYLAHYNAIPKAPDPWANQDIVIWQYSENQAVDGVVDDCDFCQFTTFKNGSQGQAVTMIQEWLIVAGKLPAGSADGAFGANTQAAVTSFQTDQGLPADGAVGVKTWVALQWV
jgi:lysozyme